MWEHASMMQQGTSQNRRPKPILSCSFCRLRKLRCDRRAPCGACSRRGKADECVYLTPEQERRNAIDYRPHARSQNARQRVERLEKTVNQLRGQMRTVELTSNRAYGSLTLPSDPSQGSTSAVNQPDRQLTENMGKLNMTGDYAVYTGSTHWITILEDIQSLKDELASDDELDPSANLRLPHVHSDSAAGPKHARVSLLASLSPLPKEQILARMPPRKVVDRHISHFFNGFDFASTILHRGRFLIEYSTYWDNPMNTPIMWIGLLFSIISISAFLQQNDADASSTFSVENRDALETYRTLTIHCLIAGDYLRPKRYTIETLALHFALDQNTNVDTNIENWLLIGIIVRIALRMGLQRDPSHWPNIKPLEAEFRRRLWITLYHMDFFTSVQVGLPRIIKDSQCDAHPPANLLDDDLNREQDEMPPARPLTDPTPLSHIIQRHMIIEIAAEIYDSTEAGRPSSAVLEELGAKLEKAIASIPEQLRYQPLERSLAANPITILHQMFLDILINKAIYLLHRSGFVRGTIGKDSPKSGEICIDAALAILEHQQRMIEEIKPGGIMFGIRWRVASSLNHEFLQATMMLCFALNRYDGRMEQTSPRVLHRRDDIQNALTIAKSIWEENANRSAEARRAVTAITAVLKHDCVTSVSPSIAQLGMKDSAPRSNDIADVRNSTELLEFVTGTPIPSYIGGYNPGQDLVLDPSLPGFEDDMGAFGSLWDDFVGDHAQESWRECLE